MKACNALMRLMLNGPKLHIWEVGFIPTKVPKVPQDFRLWTDVTGFLAHWPLPSGGDQRRGTREWAFRRPEREAPACDRAANPLSPSIGDTAVRAPAYRQLHHRGNVPISVNLFFGQGLNGFESSIPLARMANERRETGETCG